MTIAQQHANQQITVFQVPGLESHPFVGGGCCMIPAEDMIRGELTSRRHVSAIAIDGARVTLTLDSPAPDLPDLLQHLTDIGYPATMAGGSMTGIISERG